LGNNSRKGNKAADIIYLEMHKTKVEKKGGADVELAT
jgi:hypothetical protein